MGIATNNNRWVEWITGKKKGQRNAINPVGDGHHVTIPHRKIGILAMVYGIGFTTLAMISWVFAKLLEKKSRGKTRQKAPGSHTLVLWTISSPNKATLGLRSNDFL